MQPSHTRLICRAHNRYAPSAVLWHHFVLSSLPTTPRQRLLSTVTEAAQAGTSANFDDANTKETLIEPGGTNGSQQANNEGGHVAVQPSGEPAENPSTKPAKGTSTTSPKKLPVRRMTTVKGRFLGSKQEASVAKNSRAQKDNREQSLTGPEKLLAKTRRAFSESKEYEGVAVMPIVPTTLIKESCLPWCVDRERVTSGMNRLDMEIDKFYKYSRPTQHEQNARKHVIDQVRNHVLERVPKHHIDVFGSQTTGLALPTSDIDFRLRSQRQVEDPKLAIWPPPEDERRKCVATLRDLFYKVFKKKGYYILTALRHARYPLIVAQDQRSGLDVQIVLANDTWLSREIMAKYMQEIPYLQKLFCVIKTILNVRGLSDVFRGGFGSYSLFMMVVASIKHMPHPRNDAAGALMNFLEFWAKFDTKTKGVSLKPVEYFDKIAYPVRTDTANVQIKNGEIKPLPDYMLCLRDPADPTNDLGRKGIAIKHVQATFAHLHRTLAQDVKQNTRISLLTPLVGTSYMLNLRRREKLENYGQHLSKQTRVSLAQTAKAIREADRVVEKKQEVAVHTEDKKMPQTMAREGQNEGPQEPAKVMEEVLQTEAQKTTLSEEKATIPPSSDVSAVRAVADGSQQPGQGSAENATAQAENNIERP
ncbi:TRF4 DNA polymerase sigma [Pyrenophora tritici-repentis]|nr:TRF4 DNA polymerase sigma [Pyrenophora tritici-repentis]PZD28365.1 TRF4, DNA polymerase sigma [Pyrenophora tritici-repentis]PZD39249.1 TRF4, DNA polymerase sigma [Pyrenophora tritici-repentis]